MKKINKLLALILPVLLVFSLCSCINININTDNGNRDKDSTVYLFYATYIGGKYVKTEELEGNSVTLKNDGTGYLDWGDDNKGPISEWTADGENLIIKAGVSEMNATLKGGILTIDLSDEDYDWQVVFIEDAVDTSSMPLITPDELAKLTEEDAAVGEYTMFGISNDSYPDVIVSTENLDGTSIITLKEDGTGTMLLRDEADDEYEVKWEVNDGKLSLTDDSGTLEAKIADGVIELHFDDQKITAYYAKDGADLDDYETITQEEFLKTYK